MPDPRKKLYDALTTNNFELGTFDEFNSKMDNPNSRQKFYKAVSTNNFDLGSFDDFESKIGGKKKSQNPGSESTSSVQKSASVPKTGSLDGQASTKNSKGFPLIDTNSVAPGYGQQPEAESYASKLKRKEERIAKNKRVKELESSFYEATKNNTDDIEAEKRLNDKLQTKGIWNNITATAKNAYNTVVQSLAATSPTMTGLYGTTINTDPLAEEKSQVKKEAIKNKVNLTEQELNTKAQELFKSKEKENLFIDRANSFLDNIDEKDKNLLQQDRANKAMHLQEDNMKKYKVVKAMQSVASEKIRDLQKIKKQLQSNPELAQQYNSLVEEIKNIGGTIDKYQNDIQKNKNDLGSVNEELDLFKREYGDLNNFVGNVTATAKELGAGLQGSYLWLGNTIGGLAGKSKNKDWTNAMQMAEGRVSDQVKSVANERETLRKPVQSIESAEGFMNYTSDLVANQLPILAATSTGAGGLATLGMSSAGQKYTEMKGEVKEGKENYTAAQMAFAPILYGAAEVVSEIPTLSILKKGGRVIESIARNESQVLAKTAKQKAKEWAKDYGIDMAKEMSGEQFTNFTQNFNDKYILGKKEVNLLDNTGKVFKDTFALTSILKTSPHVFGAIVKPFQSKNDLGVLDENSRKIIEFSKQLNSENLTDTERSVIENQIQKATKESSEIVQNTIGKIDNMPSELYDEVVNLNSKAGEIKAQAQEINDGNLPNKKDLLKGLQEEYKALQNKRNSIIEGNTSVVDVLPLKEQEVLKKQAMEDLVTELNPDGKKNITITNEQVVERANEIYTESKNNEANKTQTSSPSSTGEATPSVNESNNSQISESNKQEALPQNKNEIQNSNQIKEEVNIPKEFNFSEEEKTNVQKKVVEEPRVILRRGNLGSDAFFALPNEGIYGEVVDKIGSDSNYSAYQYPEDFKIKDLSNDVVFDDYMSNKMYEQTKEDGYDAAYVMEIDGSKVLHIVNPGKLKLLDDKLPELRNNEGTSPTNTPTDGNIQSGTESNVAQGKDNEVQPSVKPKTNKGEVVQKLQEINKTTFGLDEKQSKANAVVMEKTIETMAERAGISKEEMFDQIDFEKGDATTIDKLTKKGKALFQIIGKNAKLSKEVKQFLSDAKSLEKKGANPKDIFIQTGWEKGTDGKWKYDMQEGKVEFKKTENGNLEDVLDYPELFDKYPEAKGISIVFNSNMDMEGMFDPAKNRIFINPSSGIDESRLTLLHEIQHWIQNKEGFSKGGTENEARTFINRKINSEKNSKTKKILNAFRKLVSSKSPSAAKINQALSKLENISEKSDFDIYQSIAGEVEARNVENRSKMNAEDRVKTPISETENIAREDQIILTDKGSGKMFQIIGEKANLSNEVKADLTEAQKLDKEGVDSKEIYKKTGWEKGTDGKWKFDMNEGKVEFDNVVGNGGEISDVLDYEELYKKYPETRDLKLLFNDTIEGYGFFYPKGNMIVINPNFGKQKSKSTILHEIQHWIQMKEGFAVGGNLKSAKEEYILFLNNKIKEIEKMTSSENPNLDLINKELSIVNKVYSKEDFDLYESLSGEVESRNVESRMDMSENYRRNTPISETEDVGRDEQLILFQGEQGAMLAEDGKYIIYALTDPNVSTPLHEMAHVYEHYLTDAEKQTVLDEAGHESWTRETSEFFARGFEKYLADGIAPNPEMKKLFESFKKWLTEIYKGITNSEIDIKLSPEMQKVFDAMLGEKTNFDKNKNTDGKKSAKKDIQGNNGTKKNGVEKNTDSSKKPKKEEYLKISQKGKTPLSERKFKGDRYKANAIQPTDEYSLVLNYFVSGGKISSDTILELFDSESEVKARNNGFNGIASKKGVTLNALAHQLWEDNMKFSISKIKDNIIDVVSSHNTIQEVTDTILKNNNVEAQDNEIDRIEAENAFFEVAEEEKASEEEMQEAQSILDQLTESEIAELADNIEMSYADFVKDLENRMVTFDLGPFTNNKGIIQSDGNIVNDEGEFFSKESVSNVKYVNKQEPKTEAQSKKVTEQFLDWLDEMENNLDQFGKENLSSGLPIVVAKASIQAMRVAVKSGMVIAEVIEAGLDAVKASEWYKNLSQKDKSQAEKDFMDSFGNPKIDEPSQRQTENLLNRSVSDKISEEDAYEEVKSTFEKSRTELINKKSFKEYAREAYRNYVKRFTDRQYLAKSLLNKSGMQSVKNRIINAHGASGRAKIQFEEAYNEIYKGLSTTERNTLDEIIQAKRFIAIDENREARGLEPVSHPNFIDKNISKKFLSKLEKELGSEKYNDLSKRAEAYFKTYKGLLKNMFDNGLISQASYDSMSDVDYQPRVFLQFVTDFNGDLETSKRTNNVDSGGLSADQIKSMSEGDANSLVLNSEWLLMNSLLSRSKAIAMNNINKRFMTGEFQAAQKRLDALDPKNLKGDDVRFYKYFKELSSKIIDNPVIGKKETGSPKFKYDKTPDNFGKAYYYIDGVRNEFFIENELHESWNDNLEGIFSSNLKEFLPYISGAALVKAIATGNNPAFPIVNTPRDFMFTIAFSDQYSKIVPKAMFQVAKDVVNSIKEIRKSDSDILKKYIEYGGAMDFLSSQGTLKKESLIGQIIDKNVSANTRDIAKDIFSKVTLHKISQYSEMMFRLGIFQRSIKNQLEDLGFTNVSEVKDAQQLDDIYTNAVANARSILDFNQGGSVTKDLEVVIPYINVAFQGGRVVATAFENDPVGTSARVMQVATMASIVPIGISLALISALKSDDDEEKSSYDIYLDALSGISRYQKMKYMNIVTGIKDDEGQYQVIKIAKAQELSPVMSVTDDIYNNFIRKLAGKEKKTASRIIDDAVFTFNSNVMPVDFTSPAGLVTRNPMAKATLTYLTGYDFFKEEPLSADIGKVPKPVEGLNNPNVEDFYKKLGTEYGMSPVRSKAFVESLITGPNTNPFVGMLYGGADAAFSNKGMKEIGADLAKSVYKSTGKRLISYTSDFNRQLDANKDLQDKIDKINIEKYKMKAEFNQLAKDYMNKDLSKEELNKKIQELEPEDRLRMIKKIKDKIRMKDIDGNILDIKYEQEPEAKALLIMHYYGDVFDGSKESKEVLRQMKRAKGVLTPKVMFEYKKLKNQLEMKKTPN